MVIVDRFEGIYAVCEKEDRSMINLKISDLPQGVKEGTVLKIDGDSITIDEGETEKRRKNIDKLTKDMWQ